MGGQPQNVGIGGGLGRPLNNLGTLLRAAGRVDDAEAVYRRSVQIREALWRDVPSNVDIKAGYASSLCSVGRWDEAERFVDEVLAIIPTHPYAIQLKSLHCPPAVIAFNRLNDAHARPGGSVVGRDRIMLWWVISDDEQGPQAEGPEGFVRFAVAQGGDAVRLGLELQSSTPLERASRGFGPRDAGGLSGRAARRGRDAVPVRPRRGPARRIPSRTTR